MLTFENIKTLAKRRRKFKEIPADCQQERGTFRKIIIDFEAMPEYYRK